MSAYRGPIHTPTPSTSAVSEASVAVPAALASRLRDVLARTLRPAEVDMVLDELTIAEMEAIETALAQLDPTS